MATLSLGGERIQVQGAKELRAALRKMGDRRLLRELGNLNADLAAQVIDRARANAGSPLERKAADQLKPAKSAAAVRVSMDGGYVLGAEFGAKRWPQFKPWKGNGVEAGYFLFPAVRDMREEIVNAYADEIERVFGKDGY